MFRYYMTAMALKVLSSTAVSRRFYRDVLGNRIGRAGRVKKGLQTPYVLLANELAECCRKYKTAADGMRFLEIGTGWAHFYSLFMRLCHDVRITAVDAWDNRQLPALKKYAADLDGMLDTSFELSDEQRLRAHKLVERIQEVDSFEQLYEMLGFEYLIDPTLDTPQSQAYDLIYSANVLEHIDVGDVPAHVNNMARVLKPGGVQYHHIGIADHLYNYDRSASPKQYITYSEKTWKRFFENRLQYINLLQLSDWRRLFSESAMEILEERTVECDISRLRVDDRFSKYGEDDLKVGWATIVARKKS